jgi:hypothetical protein
LRRDDNGDVSSREGNERFTQIAIENREREDSRRRRWTDGNDDGSREYKKGKRATPGTGNTRNNIQIIKDKSTNKDQSNNVTALE